MYTMNDLRAYRKAHRATNANTEAKVSTNFANLICKNTGVTQVKPEVRYYKVEAKFDKQNRFPFDSYKPVLVFYLSLAQFVFAIVRLKTFNTAYRNCIIILTHFFLECVCDIFDSIHSLFIDSFFKFFYFITCSLY